MIKLSMFNSLISLVSYFDTESKCRKVLREQRWGKYIVCPHCGSIKCVERTDGKYRCRDCCSNFSEIVGTIFENTKVSLRKCTAGIRKKRTPASASLICSECAVAHLTMTWISVFELFEKIFVFFC